jgi:hypothetical protein
VEKETLLVEERGVRRDLKEREREREREREKEKERERACLLRRVASAGARRSALA